MNDTRNMYGCTPCPKCKREYRFVVTKGAAASAHDGPFEIVCDDCEHREPCDDATKREALGVLPERNEALS